VARVLITRARGSTPREAGAAMLVTAGESRGTIGGGTLEWDAASRARALLAEGGTTFDLEMPLGPALGQCCGGHVSLRIERADERVLREIEAAERAERAALPLVLVFGAGHVGQALARALALLPLRLRWIDGRAGEFGPAIPDGVEAVVTDAWDGEIARAPAGTACLVLTHSHALDARITAAALERGDLAYVGLIGSRSKRRRFERAFRDTGIPEERIAALVCPIGDRGIRDKRPAVIAALAAAELVEAFAQHEAQPRKLHEDATEGRAA
jgi:xanthine dehydrogenase accessory factor